MAAGRPKGSTKPKVMADALMVALNREASSENGPTKKLHVIANQLVDLAMTGDVPAIKEISDRIDGMAHQSVDLDAQLAGDFKVSWLNQNSGSYYPTNPANCSFRSTTANNAFHAKLCTGAVVRQYRASMS